MVATAAPATPVPAVRREVRDLAAATAAGGLSGLLIGGVGGRLAMLLLRLTSSDSLRGMQTDDQFDIGPVTLSTIFLLAVCAGIGALGGLLYGGLRRYLPADRRPWIAGALGGLVGGAVIVHPGGVDFTFLDPQALAIALFVVIPGVGAWLLATLGERWVGSAWFGSRRGRTALAMVPVLALVPFAPFTLPVVAVVAAATWAARRGVADDRRVRTAVLVVVVAVCALAAADLVGDAVEIL